MPKKKAKANVNSAQVVQDLEERVAFLEGVLWSLGKLLTGKTSPQDLAQPLTFPINQTDQAAILTSFSEVLTLDKTNTCPPWCTIHGTQLVRPPNWPPEPPIQD